MYLCLSLRFISKMSHNFLKWLGKEQMSMHIGLQVTFHVQIIISISTIIKVCLWGYGGKEGNNTNVILI